MKWKEETLHHTWILTKQNDGISKQKTTASEQSRAEGSMKKKNLFQSLFIIF